MTCPGLLSCKPHVKEFRGDTSSQLLLLMKHHQAILSNYRNARSPFWPRMWYPFWGQQRVQAIPGQGCSSSVAGGPGWVRTQYTPPPPQQWGLGKSCSHITSWAGWSTVPCLHARASSSKASALQYGVRITQSHCVAIHFSQILFGQ